MLLKQGARKLLDEPMKEKDEKEDFPVVDPPDGMYWRWSSWYGALVSVGTGLINTDHFSCAGAGVLAVLSRPRHKKIRSFLSLANREKADRNRCGSA